MPKKVEETDIEPIDRRFTVSRAQSLFLEAIKQTAPEVLDNLAEISKPEFSSRLAVMKALERWANSWNINTSWILKIAYDTFLGFKELPIYLEDSFEFIMIDIWEKRDVLPEKIIEDLNIHPYKFQTKDGEKSPIIRLAESSFLIEKFLQEKIPFEKVKREIFWSFVSIGWDIPDISKLVKKPKGFEVWQADIEPRKFYLEKAGSLIEKEIESSIFFELPKPLKSKIKQAKLEKIQEYCNEVVNAYLDLQDENKKFLWKKVESKISLKRNAVWAVKFLVLKQDFSKIAFDENVVHTTVSREVKSFLELVGFAETKTKRGRRQGSKNSDLAKLGK